MVACFLFGFAFGLSPVRSELLDYDALIDAAGPFDYAQNGNDWGGMCTSGQSQTPVNLVDGAVRGPINPVPMYLRPPQDWMRIRRRLSLAALGFCRALRHRL